MYSALPLRYKKPLQVKNYIEKSHIIVAVIKKALEINYFDSLGPMFEAKCNRLCNTLEQIGLKPIRPSGGYFVLADISRVNFPYDSSKGTRDFEFCRWLPKEIGVAAIPPR